jgi:Flp pilus assembly protein TadG
MHTRIRKIRLLRRLKRVSRPTHWRRDELGIALTEVAIVMPIMLLLFAATAEFGRYFYEYTTLAKAARLGSRYLITSQIDPLNPTVFVDEAKAKNLVVFGNVNGTGTPILTGLSTTHVIVSKSGGIATVPEVVKVEIVGYKHQPIFDLGKMLNSTTLSMNVDVKPSVTMHYLLTQPSL